MEEKKKKSPAILCILVVYNLSGLDVIFHFANQACRSLEEEKTRVAVQTAPSFSVYITFYNSIVVGKYNRHSNSSYVKTDGTVLTSESRIIRIESWFNRYNVLSAICHVFKILYILFALALTALKPRLYSSLK